MSTQNDEVGYGKPPKHSRFQKGQSGNRNGRPKKPKVAADFDSTMRLELNKSIPIKRGDKEGTTTKQEALIQALVVQAGMGNAAGLKLVRAVDDQKPPAVAREDGGDADPDYAKNLLRERWNKLVAAGRERKMELRATLREHGAPDHLITAALGVEGYDKEERLERQKWAKQQLLELGVPAALLEAIDRPELLLPFRLRAGRAATSAAKVEPEPNK